MKREKLKTPDDYEIFSFRVSQEQKDRLNSLTEGVVDIYNRKKGDDEKKFRKNDIIMEAIEIGLAAMKRKKAEK